MTDTSHSLRPLSSSLNTLPKRPDWWPFAQAAIVRLRMIQADLALLERKAREGDGDAFDTLLEWQAGEAQKPRTASEPAGHGAAPTMRPANTQADHLEADHSHSAAAQGGDPYATDHSGFAPELPSEDLLLMLRLAATFGSEDGLRPSLAPGAVTVLKGHSPDRRLGELLASTLLPQGWATSAGLSKLAGPEVLQVPERMLSETDLPRYLARRAPLLLAVERQEDIPPLLMRPHIDTRVLELAPIDADLLVALLRASHSATGQIDEAAVRRALPAENRLATLEHGPLILALRATTAVAVAERLAALARPETKDASASHARPEAEAIRGSTPAHDAARRIMDDLCRWRDGCVDWSDLSRGLLIHGAPGTGKSYLARRMAAHAGVQLIDASFAAWQSAGHLGLMLRAMQDSFDEAIAQVPCILFIDEVDAAGSRFSRDQHGSTYHTQVVNGFLQQIDRLSRDPGVILVGACNQVDNLDPAILRPGRFDEIVEMPLPGPEDIVGILNSALKVALSSPETVSLAREAVGRTLAELDAAIRAASSDARHSGTAVTADLLRRHLGLHATDPDYLYRIAVHEAGHALVATMLEGMPASKVSIWQGGGVTAHGTCVRHSTSAEIDQELTVHMAGRAAETLVLGNISAGAGGNAQSDLAKATALATRVGRELGLGIHGALWLGPTEPQRLPQQERDRIRSWLDRAERRATALLEPHRERLTTLAKDLVEARELKGSELAAWLEDVAAPEAPPS